MRLSKKAYISLNEAICQVERPDGSFRFVLTIEYGGNLDIGEDGFGFRRAMKTLSGIRIGTAAQTLGIAQGA